MVLDAVAAIGFAPRSALTKIQDPLKRSSSAHPQLAIQDWPHTNASAIQQLDCQHI